MFIKIVSSISLISLLIGCNSSDKPKEETINKSTVHTDTNNVAVPDEVTIAQLVNLSPLYQIGDDGSKATIKKLRSEDSAMLTPTHLTNILNNTWKDKVLLLFEKQGNDTAYVSIPESNYLTQKMGSTGAEGYLVSAVYTLTELKGVKYVNINFEPGDHLSPGVYSRKDFK